MSRHRLQDLQIFDPDLAAELCGALESNSDSPPGSAADRISADILWAFGREENFGSAFAAGILRLLKSGNAAALQQYRELVRNKGAGSAAVGRLLALHLPPALQCGDSRMPQRLLNAMAVLEAKGPYTLQRPLEAVSAILEAGDPAGAAALLRLLSAVYSQKLSYSRSQHLALRLPRAALQMPPSERRPQLEQLTRVAAVDQRLVDALLDGLDGGLQLLSEDALPRFVDRALAAAAEDRLRLERLLSLSMRQARDWMSELQVAVPLTQVRGRLNQYLRARTGLNLTVRAIPKSAGSRRIEAYSDGRCIYLPERIQCFDSAEANRRLYGCLTRFESGYYEFGTFDFDCRRAVDRCRQAALRDPAYAPPAPRPGALDANTLSDLNEWFSLFPYAHLAEDLFHVFEHGRIRRLFAVRYPGLVRSFLPLLQREWHRRFSGGPAVGPLNGLYAVVALDVSLERAAFAAGDDTRAALASIVDRFAALAEDSLGRAEETAVLAAGAYSLLTSDSKSDAAFRRELQIPYGRRLRPDLFYAANVEVEKQAGTLQAHLRHWGVELYRGTIRQHLRRAEGRLNEAAIADMIKEAGSRDSTDERPDARELAARIAAAIEVGKGAARENAENGVRAWRYPEWDCHLGDYLHAHTRVRERRAGKPASQDKAFYEAVLERYPGLVRTVRRAFEMLRPQGLKLYRRWVEGDEFDYRALIDYQVDRRSRRTPSEKLYMKRVKEIRDVAVLLLVDLSRSTSNFASGSGFTVLDVEKDAIVLFTQALETVGDAYAVAGFSGTGPLGVDYYCIKDFEETLDDAVRERIAAMAPRRNTRMGAAIRHAAARMAAVTARVRLLILLGDGFPNDLDYKHDYAVADTRKAISELRAQGIHVHAVTVNIDADPRLDELYGDIHHSVISEVRDLPDRMWRIYGALTR